MKFYSILYIFILAGLLFTSCEKEAEVKLPPVEPKLVVSCLIYPQNPLTQVAVSSSAPIYNSNASYFYQPIIGATVIISDGSNSWVLPFDTIHKTYTIDSLQLKIRANVSYKLTVSTADGKAVEASTTVPAMNTTLTYSTYFDSKLNKSKLKGTWQDPPNSRDYYRFEVGQRNSSTSDWYYFDAVNISDEENPGSTLSGTVEFYENSNDTLYATLSTGSSEFYNYFSRASKLTQTDIGPFSEPIPMYTNVKGGLGIFAGFNQFKVKIKI